MRPKAYEGNENYIFISYSHKDTEQAFQVMESLQKEGYRIWYDDGIVPGSEWPENIAQHLNNAAMVMALITPNSMESHNCRREINFALAKMKPFLSVVLEPTEMSLGMEMQLSAQHNILRYNYANWDDFIKKILSCPDIEPCKETDGTEVPMQIDPEPVTTQEVEPEPVKTVPVTKQPAEQEKKQKEIKLKKEKTKKPLKKILAVVAAVIVLAVAAVLIIPAATTVDMSWGETISKSETYVFVYQETLTQEDLEAIAALDELVSLKFEKCDMTACDFTGLRLDSVQLQELSFEYCTGVNDFGFLSDLPLESLRLNGCESFQDLSTLDYTNMSGLWLNGTGVSDLSCLEGLGLQRLHFDRTAVTDIRVLETMENLTFVSGAYCDITDISSLAKLENLGSICFSGCPIGEVPVTFSALRLEELKLADCWLTNLNGFRDVTMLETLDISGNPGLTDLSWLDEQNYATLTAISVGGTGLTAESIAFIANCDAVEYLDVNGIPMENLAFCQDKHQLKTLYASNCGLTDISALSSCENLGTAILSFNQIEDASALSTLILAGYGEVDLSYNAIEDFSNLSIGEMDVLLLHGNGENAALTIPKGLTSFKITVDWCEGLENSSLSNLGDYVYIYMLDCPNNQKLMLEEALGSGYVHFIDQEQLLTLIKAQEIFYESVDYEYQLALYDAT